MDLTDTKNFEMELRNANNSSLPLKIMHKNTTTKEVRPGVPSAKNKSDKRNIYHLLRDLHNFYGYQLTTLDKLILYSLESRGEEKRPSHEELADNCLSSTRSIQRALKAMKKAELITWDNVPNNPNWYHLNEEWIEKQVLETRKERKAKKELEREKRSKIKPKWEMVTSNGTSVLTSVTDKEIKEEINT